MRIVQIITAATIAFGSTTAAFAASPATQISSATDNVAQSVQFNRKVSGTAEIINVSEKRYNKDRNERRQQKREAQRRAEKREARRDRERRYERRHSDNNNDLATTLGLLGIAAIIANDK